MGSFTDLSSLVWASVHLMKAQFSILLVRLICLSMTSAGMIKMMRFIFVFSMVCWFANSAVAQSPTALGTVITIDGNAYLLRNKARVEIEVASEIFRSDVIITEANSLVRLLLKDDTILDVREKSKFAFSDYKEAQGKRDAQFDMDYGSVRASVTKKLKKKEKMEIKTKSASFAVRGTDFNVKVDQSQPSQATLNVFTGEVIAVGANSQKNPNTKVSPQQQLLSGSSDVGKPATLPTLEMNRIFELSRVNDQTISQDLIFGDLVNRRNLGASSLRTLNKVMEKPFVSIPANAIRTPGVFQPSAQAVAPGSLNVINLPVDVGLPQ